ncbi:uncharacterized protein M421DRAFT_90721 [Didymella exigua CBS 183.55]|uniref:Uncharacterized protein n=1 Tax=Didymella exigua CBS 183.55 TaxID=1150837 RepID=A0A6A5RTZ9_9PLEO|nr:uncharacterized protein M421DRAFT_90721 [Didymella exigua CBS 183.55]KAF1930943.1 hypothetical protein M421DRAFT_90721 [Didymella exigua CBS 183.55]
MAFGQSDNNEFFNSWALWQKMTFVLACGIVVTIFLGLLKLWYDRSKIRKYSKVDKGKQAATPEMLESQPVQLVQADEMKDEIPFGVRAIESGIEIDGVWISRSNTPVGSSRASIVSENRLPRSFNNSALELPQMSYASSRGSSAAPSSFDRAVSAERLPTNDSRSGSPPNQGHQTRPGPSSSRYSQSNFGRNSTTPANLEQGRSGPPSPRNGQFGESSGSSKKSSRRTSDESDYMAVGQDVRAYETAYMRPSSGLSPIDPRTDLDLLQTHRMSHVAETGQLTPRVRKPGNSGEWASVADNQVATHNGVNYFMPQKTPSPPLPPIVDPQEEAAGYASSHVPASQPQEQNQYRISQQGVPLQESYAPNAPYYPDTYQVRGPQHQPSYDEVPYEVQTMQNNQRPDSQVLRSVNSGFQVLKPGTFAPPAPEEMEMTDKGERRQSTGRKLQKKRRSSGESRKSAFTEQV